MSGRVEHLVPRHILVDLARSWVREDCPSFDVAGSIISRKQVRAQIKGKSSGVLSGRPFVQVIFEELGCCIEWKLEEGSHFEPVTVIAEITGEARSLLLGERVVLNLLARASAIATKCRRISKCLDGTSICLAGTRKTTPGFRIVEKYAMLVGGCDPHRYDLSSMIMLKDNHIDILGSIAEAVKQAKQLKSFSQKIEVECRSLEDGLEALQSGADVVMLDNAGAEQACQWSLELKSKFPNAIIEVSGGINEQTISSYSCQTNRIDIISMGSLTQDIQHPIFKKVNLRLDKGLPTMTSVYQGEIQKSETDKCLYRHITLKNGLDALLIHEPDCDKAAASLDVHVGSYFDPENIPGLAHFLEHLLFMGTEKYPNENDYGKFLNEHGGSSNAFTAAEHTNYFFDVNSEHLEGAFDRFSQFFVAPLFLESSTEREMQAVDSEHSKNILQDNWRLSQLEKSLSNPEHPYHKFGTGDLKTLGEGPKEQGINVRDVLLDFHKRWYSANIMKLVVLGRESLDELQAMVELRFSAVSNNEVVLPDCKAQPWTDEHCQTFIRVKSIKDVRTLYITFLCPDVKEQFLVKPHKFLSHLVGHEGHGSILQLLKQKGWATSLSAGADDDSSGYSFFEVTVELSSSGLEHYKEVIDVVYSYIKMLKKEGLQSKHLQSIASECMRLSNIEFRFKEREDPSSLAYKTARNMQRYPPKYSLSGAYIQEEEGLEEIEQFLSYITFENSRVVLASRNHPETKWEKERWYGTEYKVSSLKEHVIRSDFWDLHLPEENPFVPEKFDVLIKPALSEPAKQPALVLETELFCLRHKIDDTFETPKAIVRMLFRSPLPTSSIDNAVALQLFIEALRLQLTPEVYPAELAGLSYSFSVVNEGLELKISGFAEKLDLFLETIMSEFGELTPSDSFEMLRERDEKQLANMEHEQPYWHCSYLANGITQQKTWWYWQRLEGAKRATAEQVIAAGKQLLAQCFVDVLVHGSIDKPEVFTDILSKHLGSALPKPAPFQALEINGSLTYRLPKPLDDPNAAIEVYYQTADIHSVASRALTGLFIQAFSEPFFDQLRTKEQLGYIVYCGKREKYDRLGVRFVIQSTKGDPIFLETRILEFIRSVPAMLDDMTDTSFDDINRALIQKLRQKKVRLSQETSKYWEQIVSSALDWSHSEDEAKYLEEHANIAELKAFAQLHFLTTPDKLTVQAWPSSTAFEKEASFSSTGGPPLVHSW